MARHCSHDGGCLTCGCVCGPADSPVCPCCGADDRVVLTPRERAVWAWVVDHLGAPLQTVEERTETLRNFGFLGPVDGDGRPCCAGCVQPLNSSDGRRTIRFTPAYATDGFHIAHQECYSR